MTPFEIVAVVVSFAGIWLTASRRMLCWPVSLVACALYFKLFLDVRLYADMVLQALFGIAILYGWIAWARGKDDAGEVVVFFGPHDAARQQVQAVLARPCGGGEAGRAVPDAFGEAG